MRAWLERARSYLMALSPRERLLVLSAGGLLLIALAFLLVVNPVLAIGDRAEQRLATADQELRVMQRLRREYDEVHHRLAEVEERIRSGSRGNLRTTLETLARKASVKVESMEPQASPAHDVYRETKVEVALRGVTLAQTVGYLHQIETSSQLFSVKSLRVRAQPDGSNLLDVSFSVSAFEPL
jgi:type II secretory pathway component PulM